MNKKLTSREELVREIESLRRQLKERDQSDNPETKHRNVNTSGDGFDSNQWKALNKDDNSRLLQIIDMNSIATIIINDKHRITHWNKACENMTGLKARDMIGTDEQWRAFYSKERPILADLMIDEAKIETIAKYYPHDLKKSAIHETAYECEDFFPSLGAHGKWLYFTAAPLKNDDGEISGAIETLQDVTERRLAENALQEQLIFLQTLLDTMPNPIFYKDANGLYLGCNKAFSDFIGVSQSDIFGKTVYDISPKELADQYAKMDTDLLGSSGIQTYESYIQHTDGSRRNVLMNKATFEHSDGTVAGIVGVIIDLTEQKRLEEQLRQAQKMEAVGTLAAGIAHDFNNILATILMNTELVLLDVPEDFASREELEQVLRSTYRAKDLVNQILTFSRQTKQVIKPMEIAPIIKESVKMLSASIPSTIEIRSSIDPQCGYINGNPVQVQQVLMNLCNNAAHAMKEFGGVLDIRLEAVSLTGSDDFPDELLPGEYIRLTVKDTGTGIDPKIAGQVFNPFFTTKAPGEGSGLGLSVVHGIVKHHNGGVTFKSMPGKGTTFYTFFPKILVDADEIKEEKHIVETGTERILIVDDEEELAKVMRKILKDLNYSVVTKTDSIEALVYFRNHPESFDLIITDLSMPKISGTDLAVRMKEIRPDIPVMLCTGFNEGITPEKAADCGIDEILKKPFSRTEFVNTIRSLLKRRDDGLIHGRYPHNR